MCLFYWAVGGNCDFQQTFTDSFLETNVAPLCLTTTNPTRWSALMIRSKDRLGSSLTRQFPLPLCLFRQGHHPRAQDRARLLHGCFASLLVQFLLLTHSQARKARRLWTRLPPKIRSRL